MNDRLSFSLACESGDPTCQKCAALLNRRESKGAKPASWTLKRGPSSWRLCASHAAQASWTHGIVCAMNPEGTTAMASTV